jgi:hypothetical protein
MVKPIDKAIVINAKIHKNEIKELYLFTFEKATNISSCVKIIKKIYNTTQQPIWYRKHLLSSLPVFCKCGEP